MDRRTFLTIALAAPAFPAIELVAQTRGTKPVKPAAPVVSKGLAGTQWGGPNRNFQTEATGLKDTWPPAGPRVVWKRALGEGYSAPVVEAGVLYTMYGRRG